MSVRVLTESTCDRCGAVHTEEGARGDCPPVAWAAVSVSIRQPGAGWAGGSARRDLRLCLDCARQALEFMSSRCDLACPHGDRCTLHVGHASGCNHAKCYCNEPNKPIGAKA